MSEQRLDELVATLAGTRPVLDDIARARIAAGIQAARDPEPVARPGRRMRWLVGGGIAAAVAIAAAIGLRARPADSAATVVPAGGTSPLPDGVPLLAAGDAAASGELAHATVTLYGRGWATHQGNRLTVEADAFVIDRATGDTPVEIAARGATIRVMHATFAVASSSDLRVTVIRGELSLYCPGAEAAHVVAAGQGARCEPPRPTPAPQPQPAATQRGPVPPPSTATPGEPSPSPPAILGQDTPPAVGAAAPAAHRARPAAGPVTGAGDDAAAGSPLAIAVAPGEPAAAPVAPADPAARYAEAERLMASDADAASRALRALVAEAPGAPEVAPALLDLARLAAAGGDRAAARAALDQLAGHPGAAALAMPAAYLRCLVTPPDDAGRRACLVGFRARYPGSPHDADALAWLAVAAARAGDCAAARPLIAEYLERHPDGPAAPAIQAWKARCTAAAAPP
jgi:hypothetical protein